ncbi:MAG: hypothetical protein MUP82_07340 [Candidatus Marinimicrobia bacterium]|nr:hypothetical protein [Candidatus Neomarinimicrobiota bacterium]
MSNAFKQNQNNRFSSLAGDEQRPSRDERRQSRTDYDSRPERNRYTGRYSKDQLVGNESKFKLKRTETAQFQLTEENFPSIPQSASSKVASVMSYTGVIDSMNNTEQENTDQVDFTERIDPGWVSLRKDSCSNKIIWTEGAQKKERNTVERTDNDYANDVLDALADLYERRDEEYIEAWGYEDWEKMFRFPNYDYNYFDKLDELAAEELDEDTNSQDELNEMNVYDNYDRWN